MPGYLRAFRADDQSNDDGPLRFIASTEGVKRDGQDLSLNQWDLMNYTRNNLFLWAHSYGSSFGGPPLLPIGRAEVTVDEKNKRLLADVTFDPDDEFAQTVRRKYVNKFLNAVSVGWDVVLPPGKSFHEVNKDDVRLDLLDISAVPIPGDPDALMERQKRAYADMGHELLKLADVDPDGDPPPAQRAVTDPPEPEPTADPPARATWDETAAAMVRVFRPFAQRPDDERQQEYARLARDYGRHKKTAPEFQTNAQLEALGPDELRGLFLEGEPEVFPDEFALADVRAGKAINARNRERLEQAAALIADVLSSVKKQADDDEERTITTIAASLDDLFAGVTT